MQNLRGEAEIKVRVKRSPRQFIRKLVLLIISIYVVIVAYAFIRDLVVASLVQVEQVQQGIIQSTVAAEGILVRNEKTVSSPRSGTVKLIAADGERVRVGQVVAQVAVASLENSNGVTLFNITAPRAGLVSYRVDGLEGVYSYKNLKELDLSKVETLKSETVEIKSGSQVVEGKPLFRIINNLDPVYVITKLKDGAVLPGEKESFLINPGPEDKVFKAGIIERKFLGKPNQILLKVSNYDSTLLGGRKFNFKIITQRYEGNVIPAKAVVKKDGKDGIYTVYKERVKWKAVEVEGKIEDKVVIFGVTPDIKVVLSPEYVKEGYPLKWR